MSNWVLCKDCKKKPIAGGAKMTKFRCPHCMVVKLSESTAIPKICHECGVGLNCCQRCLEKVGGEKWKSSFFCLNKFLSIEDYVGCV